MAGLTITSNAVTVDLTDNKSRDDLYVVTANFTITIPAGAKTEFAANVLYLTFDGDKELIINDAAGNGYLSINYDAEQNILPAGNYIVGVLYVFTEIIIKVIPI